MSITRVNAWFLLYTMTAVSVTILLWLLVRDTPIDGSAPLTNAEVFALESGQLAEKGPTIINHLKEKLVNVYDEVETFVMFIGYPRSGHSLVGAILDAHPEMIIAHEYNILEKWPTFRINYIVEWNLQKYYLYYTLHAFSSFQAMFGWRAKKSEDVNDGFYSYHVPGGWQGTYKDKIKVIGDKKGNGTIEQLATNYQDLTVLDEIQQVVGVPLKFIHVIRNPYDNIATIVLREGKARELVRDGGTIVQDAIMLNEAIVTFFQSVATVQRVRQRYGNRVLDVDGRELLFKPRETLLGICSFLGVTCYEEYLDSVSKILYGKPSVTRTAVVWTESQKRWVAREMERYTFFRTFSFDEFL